MTARMGPGWSVEPPGTHLLRHHPEHHAVRRHRTAAPVFLEMRVVLVEQADGELAALRRVAQELGSPADREAFDVGSPGPALRDDVKTRITSEIANLLQPVHADQRHCGRVV